MAFNINDMRIVNIEYTFYAYLLLLSAVSMMNIKYGQVFFYFIAVLLLSHIYVIPELEETIALESCNEGKCEQAQQIGVVNIENNEVVYTPTDKR